MLVKNMENKFKNSIYDFELDFIIKEINNNKYNIIGIQLPEGIKKYALNIVNYIEKYTTSKVFISSKICFGSCDLDINILDYVDAMFHFGHSKIKSCIPMNLKKKIYFIELKSYYNENFIIKKLTEYLLDCDENNIGLFSTIQYIYKLDIIQKKLIENTKKNIKIYSGDNRVCYPGQVLGCNFSSLKNGINNKCEMFIFIGNGEFHPLGMSIIANKEIICIDPQTLIITKINSRNYYLKRHAIISNLIYKQKKSYGILISTKLGQNRKELAFKIYESMLKLNLNVYLIILDNITPNLLRSFNVDAFINTACPRLSLDDSSLFHVPIITAQEFEIIIGKEKWENLNIDEILE